MKDWKIQQLLDKWSMEMNFKAPSSKFCSAQRDKVKIKTKKVLA